MSNPKKKKKKSKNTIKGEETLKELLTRIGVKSKDWDILIVGDGSGSSWDRQAGWASVSIEKENNVRTVWTGAINYGTVNMAELMAYLQPLEWFASREIERRKKDNRYLRTLNVHILTDSQYCQTVGETKGRIANKNAGFWGLFNAFSRQGFILHWHWMRRSDCDLNKFCDKLSRKARILHTKDLAKDVFDAEETVQDVYQINPTED